MFFKNTFDRSEMIADWLFFKLVCKVRKTISDVKKNELVTFAESSINDAPNRNKTILVTVTMLNSVPIIFTIKLFRQIHSPKWRIKAESFPTGNLNSSVKREFDFLLTKVSNVPLHNHDMWKN